jgi:hypothetical protein
MVVLFSTIDYEGALAVHYPAAVPMPTLYANGAQWRGAGQPTRYAPPSAARLYVGAPQRGLGPLGEDPRGARPRMGAIEFLLYNMAAMLASVAAGYDVRLSNVSPIHPALHPKL